MYGQKVHKGQSGPVYVHISEQDCVSDLEGGEMAVKRSTARLLAQFCWKGKAAQNKVRISVYRSLATAKRT